MAFFMIHVHCIFLPSYVEGKCKVVDPFYFNKTEEI